MCNCTRDHRPFIVPSPHRTPLHPAPSRLPAQHEPLAHHSVLRHCRTVYMTFETRKRPLGCLLWFPFVPLLKENLFCLLFLCKHGFTKIVFKVLLLFNVANIRKPNSPLVVLFLFFSSRLPTSSVYSYRNVSSLCFNINLSAFSQFVLLGPFTSLCPVLSFLSSSFLS